MRTTTTPAAPLPNWERSVVAIEASDTGPGHWVGGPSAVVDDDGSIVLAYRVRRPVGQGRGLSNVVARSVDGVHFETLCEVHKDAFGAESLERPCLVRRPDGGWRLYVSSATPGTLHWWIDALDADDPADFDPATRTPVFTGDEATLAYKDPVILHDGAQWVGWICVHEIADPQHADAMHTVHATSPDGLTWTITGPSLEPTAGTWDERGARIAAVVPISERYVAYYDGRRTAEQNWEEQTGLAVSIDGRRFTAVAEGPASVSPHFAGGLRYVSAVAMPDGATRLYYEGTGAGGSHDLRTEYVPVSR